MIKKTVNKFQIESRIYEVFQLFLIKNEKDLFVTKTNYI